MSLSIIVSLNHQKYAKQTQQGMPIQTMPIDHTHLFHSESEVQWLRVVVTDPEQTVVEVGLQSLQVLQGRRSAIINI